MTKLKYQPEIVTANLDDLTPDSANARLHSKRNIDEIARSLKEFGQHRPFVVQKSTGRILIGNGMYEAMRKLGWTEAQVLYVNDDNITATRRALADNRTAELAEWDFSMLPELLSDVMKDTDIPVPGWCDDELKELLDLSNWTPGIGKDVSPPVVRQEELPEELQGLDLTPQTFQKFQGQDNVPMERVIIVYPREQRAILSKILGVEIKKSLYTLGELRDGGE
jgi:hypothetical protein